MERTMQNKRRLTLSGAHPNKQPHRATNRPANINAPLLTLERAIADGLSPASLRQVAAANRKNGGHRLERQAAHLELVADRLELHRRVAA